MTKKDLVAFPGCAGNGKSKLMELMGFLLESKNSDGKFLVVEMRDIIAWCKKFKDDLARKIEAEQPRMDQGYLLSDECAIPAFEKWYETQIQPNANLELLLVAGIPRSLPQNCLLDYFRYKLLIHQLTTKEESCASIMRRYLLAPPEQRRKDDAGGKVVVSRRWHEWETHGREAITQANAPVLTLDRKSSLTSRLMKAFEYLGELDIRSGSPVRKGLADRALGKLRTKDHEIQEKIRKIEFPDAIEEQQKLAPPTQEIKLQYHPGLLARQSFGGQQPYIAAN